MHKQRAFKCMLVLAALALLLGLTGCGLIEPPSGTPVSPLATTVPPSPVSPLPTATRPTLVPTDDDIMPTWRPPNVAGHKNLAQTRPAIGCSVELAIPEVK